MDAEATPRRLAIDPARLDPAPDWAPLRGSGRARLDTAPACTYCDQPATATGVVEIPGLGLHWIDRCTPCLLASIGRDGP